VDDDYSACPEDWRFPRRSILTAAVRRWLHWLAHWASDFCFWAILFVKIAGVFSLRRGLGVFGDWPFLRQDTPSLSCRDAGATPQHDLTQPRGQAPAHSVVAVNLEPALPQQLRVGKELTKWRGEVTAAFHVSSVAGFSKARWR
jgi:hypothetical protein